MPPTYTTTVGSNGVTYYYRIVDGKKVRVSKSEVPAKMVPKAKSKSPLASKNATSGKITGKHKAMLNHISNNKAFVSASKSIKITGKGTTWQLSFKSDDMAKSLRAARKVLNSYGCVIAPTTYSKSVASVTFTRRDK